MEPQEAQLFEAKHYIAGLDKDGSGTLSKEELMAVQDEAAAKSDVEHADLNNDGELDVYEVQKYQYPLMTENRTPEQVVDDEIKNVMHQVSGGCSRSVIPSRHV